MATSVNGLFAHFCEECLQTARRRAAAVASGPMPRRWIAHLDMDAFYASVELLRYPELAGLPVVIGGGRRHQPERLADGTHRFATLAGYAGRGVVTTATYPARDHGIHSGMGLMKAAALAPQAVLLPTDFERYRQLSRAFKAAVAEVAPLIEDRGIDEIYIDLTEVPGAQDAIGLRFGYWSRVNAGKLQELIGSQADVVEDDIDDDDCGTLYSYKLI